MKAASVLGWFAAATITIAVAAEPSTPGQVAYPTGYRHWYHVKSMVIEAGHPLYEAFGGIHHLYANDKARAGYATGKFADGSVIAFDLLEANHEGNAINEGARKVLGVMQKDSHRFAATGGWGFEGFANGDHSKRVVGANAATACFGCHTQQKSKDFVFSTLRE